MLYSCTHIATVSVKGLGTEHTTSRGKTILTEGKTTTLSRLCSTLKTHPSLLTVHFPDSCSTSQPSLQLTLLLNHLFHSMDG